MRDAGQQRAERLELVGLDQLILRLLQFAQALLQLGIETRLLERQRGMVRDAPQHAALLVAEPTRSAIVDRQHADGLLTNAQRHRDACLDAVARQMRGNAEAALRREVVDLDQRLLQ